MKLVSKKSLHFLVFAKYYLIVTDLNSHAVKCDLFEKKITKVIIIDCDNNGGWNLNCKPINKRPIHTSLRLVLGLNSMQESSRIGRSRVSALCGPYSIPLHIALLSHPLYIQFK